MQIRKSWIPLTEAIELLNHTGNSVFYNTPSLRKHLIMAPEAMAMGLISQPRGAFFDMTRYMEEENVKSTLIEQTKLFIEYCNKELEIEYTALAKKLGATYYAVNRLEYSIKVARRIGANALKNMAKEVKQFDEYYA